MSYWLILTALAASFLLALLLALVMLLSAFMSGMPVQASAAEFDVSGWLWPVKATNAPSNATEKAIYCKNMARAYYDGHEALDISDYTGYTYAIRAAKSGTIETVYTGCGNWNGAAYGGSSCSSATCNPKKNGQRYKKMGYFQKPRQQRTFLYFCGQNLFGERCTMNLSPCTFYRSPFTFHTTIITTRYTTHRV